MASSSSSSRLRPPQQETRRWNTSFKSRVGHKPPKLRSSSPQTMDLPERFKIDDDEEDVDDGTGVGGKDPIWAQQSVYGMLAATQSRANFPSPFQQQSGSESEGDTEGNKRRTSSAAQKGVNKDSGKRKTASSEARPTTPEAKGHRKRMSEHGGNLMRSFFKPSSGKADPPTQDLMTQSQFLPSREQDEEPPTTSKIGTPVLDLKLQAMARAAMEPSSTTPGSRESKESGRTSSDSLKERGSKSLQQVIANIFQFDEPEEVLSEFPCWYLQNVLLQGYMYATQKHICFYSYLQKKTNVTIKSGELSKQGRHSYGYTRRWFVLKGDTFSYYESAAEPFFPLGQVDLRYAITADVSKDAEEVATTKFTITTPDRTYYYKADTVGSAREWVKQLRKIIFRSHNEGDSVKISLPIQNIVDVEQATMVEFAETVKVRVIADDETFAVDEYFFTFFNFGQEALAMLKKLIDGNGAKDGLGSASTKSKISPVQNSNAPARLSRGRNCGDVSQRSASVSPSMEASTESFVTTSDQAADSSTNEESFNDDMSASQMLTGDGVFRSPTLRMPPPRRIASGKAVDIKRRGLQPYSGNSSDEDIVRQPTDRLRDKRRPDYQRQESNDSSHTAELDDSRPQTAEASASERLVRGISAPLQHAMSVAGMVRSSGKRMGSYLSSSPKTYMNNWGAAIAGGKRHYTDTEGLAPDDSIREPEQDTKDEKDEQSFQKHFGLPRTEKLLASFFCWMHKTIPLYGKIYLGSRSFCFRSLWYGTNTKLVIPFKQITTVTKQRGFRWGYPGMVVVIGGYEELFFDFSTGGNRDDAVVTVLRMQETFQDLAESTILTQEEEEDAEAAAAENEMLEAARTDGHADQSLQLTRRYHETDPDAPPILFDDPSSSVLDFKPTEPLRITCLTIGSRGDVQPYIALCKGLIAEGHKCRIATHLEFKDWVEKHGIEFAAVNGDPAELMRVCVENGMFTPSFFMEVNWTFRIWLDELLQSAWTACQNSDVLIESPSAMCGIHIAEALEIPYFRAFTMPWTRTRAYPHAFSVPEGKLGGYYNYMTYTFFDNIFWSATAGQINRWRGKTLGLGPTNINRLQQNKVPFMYNFSPNVVVPPLDFSDWIKVTGYWFLDEGEEWTPPKELAAFIKKAREEEQKLVYIGFGSVTVADSKQLMQQVVDAVVKADVHCILAKGWSDRYDKKDPAAVPIQLPPCIHQIRSAPHDWLFRQVDAVVHHGGAGTTGASLRAGKPTIIKPFFGDQYFFATRVEDLGVGVHLKKVTANQLGKALWVATHDHRMRTKAAALGESIRAENGVQTAINFIYRDLEYARTLIKRRRPKKTAIAEEEALSETEETWTFIEDGEAAMEESFSRLRGESSESGTKMVARTKT